MQRPDLSNLSAEILAYIEYLENQLAGRKAPARTVVHELSEPLVSQAELVDEQPGPFSVVSASAAGWAKRTPRHLYHRQHRAGMGVFDLDVDLPDYPAAVASVENDQDILLFTSRARVFRVRKDRLEESAVRARGENLFDRLTIAPDERLVGVLPVQSTGYVALISQTGRVRILRHHLFGEHMTPGTAMFKWEEFGPLAAVCWTPGNADLFVATRKGSAIRFPEKLVTPQGDAAIRLAAGDQVTAIAPVYDDSDVFIIGADGRGALRQMSGFAANKSMGGSGKIALRTENLVTAFAVRPHDEIFIFSRLGKMIRFRADEVPSTEGVVQGAICMSLRGDEVVAAMVSGLAPNRS